MTLAEVQAQLAKWLQCSSDVATKGQARTIDSDGTSRTFTRADASKILEHIKYWRNEEATLIAQAANSGNNGSQVIYAGRVQ